MGTPRVLSRPMGHETPLVLWLQDFAINEADLRDEHREALEAYIVPFLAAGGTASILGFASRSGGFGANMTLSRRRAASAHKYLIDRLPATGMRLSNLGALGEAAAALSQRDGVEDARWRAVGLTAWYKQTKPKPPPPPPKPDLDRIYKCAPSQDRREIVETINQHPDLVIEGGSMTDRQWHVFVREHEATADPSDDIQRRMLWFYKTHFARVWATQGFCGLLDNFDSEQINRWLDTHLTKKGREFHQKRYGKARNKLMKLGPNARGWW